MCENSGIELECIDKPLPSIEDEELFQAYNDIQIKIASNPDSEELKKLEQRRIEIRNKIFVDNMELVITIINKEIDGIHDMKDKEDIYQLGYVTLLEFIDSHNITKISIFTTYIPNNLINYVYQKLVLLRTGFDQNTITKISELIKLRNSLFGDNNYASIKRLSEELNIEEDEVKALLNAESILNPISIDEEIDIINGELKSTDAHPSDKSPLYDDSLEEYIFYKRQQDYIMKIIDTIPTENQKLVIILFFGLNGESEHTIEEIAKVTGTTTKNISPILKNALNNLKHSIRSKYLYQYALDQEQNDLINPLEEVSNLKRGAFKKLEIFLIKYLKQEELLEIIGLISRKCQDEVLIYLKLSDELSKDRQKEDWRNYYYSYALLKENGLATLRELLKTRYVDNNPNENITNYFDYLMHNYLTKTRRK